MSQRLLFALASSAVLLASCGTDTDGPPLAGHAGANNAAGDQLYQQAKQADDSGDQGKALKLYEKTADEYPLAPSSAQARFRQAQILDQKGDVLKAFDAYQKFLERSQGSSLYSNALNRQATLAQSAADGEVKTNFLGLKSGLATERVVKMLEQVRDNAPKSATASKAQFTIGALHQSRKEERLAIAAYQKLVSDFHDSREAPEGQFRIGKVYIESADRGNQNQATLAQASEALQDYLNQYPGHGRNGEARKLISELGGRNVQKTFDVAEFYLKTGETESAKVYFRDVIARAGSGPLYQKSKARLAELGER
jgi:outer membrane protein assembly factor BamD (BamD/ComL family)